MLSLIDGGPKALDQARALRESATAVVVPAAGQRLLAPVPEPRQMRDCLCFEKHLKQASASMRMRENPGTTVDPETMTLPAVWYKQPIYYKGNRFSVIGPEADVQWPSYSKLLDYETGVLHFHRKRRQEHQARSGARPHLRLFDLQRHQRARRPGREMAGMLGPAKGKDFDTGNVMGPWLVTADEIPDPYNLTMTARVNGKEWSRGNSGEMHHKFEDILAHVSRDETIRAGEFFGSGTVGSGCGAGDRRLPGARRRGGTGSDRAGRAAQQDRRANSELERFRVKWIPVRVKKTRKNKKLERRSDSIRTDRALDV